MWSPRRHRGEVAPLKQSFGRWVLRCFSGGTPLESMPFSAAERVAANTAAALCGALSMDRDALASGLPLPPGTDDDAALVARRTADGFAAALADPAHTVITWPWDHLATRVTWEASRDGALDDDAVGLRLLQVSGAYAVSHADQLTAALDLWRRVAGEVERGNAPDLAAMGARLHRIYLEAPAAAVDGPTPRP